MFLTITILQTWWIDLDLLKFYKPMENFTGIQKIINSGKRIKLVMILCTLGSIYKSPKI